MPVPLRYVLNQGPVIGAIAGAIARTALTTLRPGKTARAASPLACPGPEIVADVNPPPGDLVRAYVRHVGGDLGAYRGVVPPHLFPQWVFPVVSRTLDGVPYPLARVLNAGCRLEIRAPLPLGERLKVAARLVEVDDNGHRAIIHQRAVTSTREHAEALVTHLYALVPLGGSKAKDGAAKKDRPRVPDDAVELARWRLSSESGLDFAKLTGDFNPVHWVPRYARAFGFRSVILHGFSTMARAFEGLARAHYAGDTAAIHALDVRFTRPLVLPHDVGLYVHERDHVYVGDAPGGPAYLVGTFEAHARVSPVTPGEEL